MQNDIEKAIDNLETADRHITHNPSEFGDNWLDISNSIDFAIEALQEKQEREWISVAERLPDRGERILFSNGNFVAEGYLNINKVWHRYDGIAVDLFDIKVTHWMSLPKPPEVTE